MEKNLMDFKKLFFYVAYINLYNMSHISKQEKRDLLEKELRFAWKNYTFLSRLDRKYKVKDKFNSFIEMF
jgi:hypothetical protein